MTEQEVAAIRREIRWLWQFWQSHSCEKCTDDMKKRSPEKRFPMLSSVMEGLK